MSTLASLQTLNNETETLLKNKEFNNSKTKSNLKQAKVSIITIRSVSTVTLISNTNPSNTSTKQVTPFPLSPILVTQPSPHPRRTQQQRI